MKNGNLCQPVKLQGKTIMIRNTCAFDFLLHITAHMIGMSIEYKSIIQSTDDHFLRLAEKVISRGKIAKNEYMERAPFLNSISLFEPTRYTRKFNTLSAMCNAAHLAEHTFFPLPSLERIKTCKMCDYSNNRKFILLGINVDVLLDKGLGYVQNAIDDTISKHTCMKM